MFCTSCGITLREQDRFCSQCGKPTELARTSAPRQQMPLALDKRNKKIAGVCSGFARYLEVDVTLVRIVVLVFALVTGIGFIAYLIAWLLMPNGAEVQPAPPEGALQQS